MAKILLSLCLVILSLAIVKASREMIYLPPPTNTTKTLVRITNTLGDNRILTIHCKSKDDDLGVHDLGPIESFDIYFNPQFFGGTLFFCLMKWPGEWYYFNVYDQNRDMLRCHRDCRWNVYATGPCDAYSGKCYPWNPKG